VQVTQQQRDHAKQLTYGLLYGMGPVKLADELGCSVGEARAAQVSGYTLTFDGWLTTRSLLCLTREQPAGT
jgi:DNA polymerase I-like protein with 3'-5' exonuclease and polymerase domains